MKHLYMYFSSKDIPELANKPLKERAELIYKAQAKLTVPEKLILNLLKLVLLIPPFIYLARQDWGVLTLTVALSLVGYMLIFKPISFTFLQRHLK